MVQVGPKWSKRAWYQKQPSIGVVIQNIKVVQAVQAILNILGMKMKTMFNTHCRAHNKKLPGPPGPPVVLVQKPRLEDSLGTKELGPLSDIRIDSRPIPAPLADYIRATRGMTFDEVMAWTRTHEPDAKSDGPRVFIRSV